MFFADTRLFLFVLGFRKFKELPQVIGAREVDEEGGGGGNWACKRRFYEVTHWPTAINAYNSSST